MLVVVAVMVESVIFTADFGAIMRGMGGNFDGCLVGWDWPAELETAMAMRWPLTASPISNSVVIDPYSSFFLQLMADVDNHLEVDP